VAGSLNTAKLRRMNYPKPYEWLQLIAEYEKSGLTQKEFVAQQQVHLSTFQYWLYRRSKRSQLASKPSPTFLPVEVVASPALKARAAEEQLIEVATHSGLRLRFEVGTNVRYLTELLAAMG
jgi:hypothetical protein